MHGRARGLSALAVAVLALALCQVASAATIHTGLALHATLDAADRDGTSDGDTVYDVSPAPDYDGTVTHGNGSIAGQTGILGEAVALTSGGGGVNDARLDFGNNLDPGTGSYTASIWINTTDSGGAVLGKGQGVNSEPGWFIYYSKDTVYVRINDDDSTDDSVSESTSADIDDGNWHHLALVIDHDADELIGYFDGTAFTDGTVGADFGASDNFQITTAELLAGVRWNGGNRAFGFDGAMDDLGIWTRALGADEIGTLYQSGLDGLNISQIPEPATLVLLGLAGTALLGRRPAVRRDAE